MKLLNLEKKFRATILPAKENTLGMLKKIMHYVSWQEIDISITKELLEKKGRKAGYKKITSEDLSEIGFKTMDELASSLTESKSTLSKLKPLKPWFAMAPPKHGFKRSTKKLYGQKGILGHNKELITIIRRMM
jgi:large subunit ribosomal protein L30